MIKRSKGLLGAWMLKTELRLKSHSEINTYVDRVFELVRRYGWPDKKTVGYFVHGSFPYVLQGELKAGYRTVLSFSSYFHEGVVTQLEHISKPQLTYFNEFERFRKKLSGTS